MGIEAFDAPANIEQFHPERPISKLMLMIWQSRKDLQIAFNLDTKADQEAFFSWYEITVLRKSATPHSGAAPAASHYSRLIGVQSFLARVSRILPEKIRNKAKLFWLRLIAGAARSASHSARQQTLPEPLTNLPPNMGTPGANLIGYARAELGMGEHVRMTARALSKTSVPFGVVDFGAGTASRQKASLDYGSLINSNEHKANIFHVNADQILLAYTHLGRNFFEQRFNIGFPFWELSKFPQEWIPPMQLMDEVWAPTTFIQKALTEALGKTVPHMPVGVVLPAVPQFERKHFGLPDDQYLFFFAFDCFSYIERKNPYAIVAAFKTAFPNGNEKCGLIIKAMNADKSSENWKRLVNIIGGDKRIRLINETMDKPKLLGLKSQCDCYISLHRAEGLGLGPMEAMLLGKPVVVTNYSGSTDYAKPDNACLVDYKLVQVKEGQYLFHENQVWAEPDVDHAARHMKKLANDPEFGIALGRKATAFISSNFNPAQCGQLYKQRLQELGML